MTEHVDPFEPEEKEKIKAGVVQGSDLASVGPSIPKISKEIIHPIVSIEQLERASSTPFEGRPDPDFPELDSLDPLYIPRFLVRRWGPEKFLRSTYYEFWKSEAERAKRIFPPDLKPLEQKKKRR